MFDYFLSRKDLWGRWKNSLFSIIKALYENGNIVEHSFSLCHEKSTVEPMFIVPWKIKKWTNASCIKKAIICTDQKLEMQWQVLWRLKSPLVDKPAKLSVFFFSYHLSFKNTVIMHGNINALNDNGQPLHYKVLFLGQSLKLLSILFERIHIFLGGKNAWTSLNLTPTIQWVQVIWIRQRM